jgi:hypothetical protein
MDFWCSAARCQTSFGDRIHLCPKDLHASPVPDNLHYPRLDGLSPDSGGYSAIDCNIDPVDEAGIL